MDAKEQIKEMRARGTDRASVQAILLEHGLSDLYERAHKRAVAENISRAEFMEGVVLFALIEVLSQIDLTASLEQRAFGLFAFRKILIKEFDKLAIEVITHA